MKNNNFESSLKRIEEIISMLEKNDMDLDESLKLFEEGTKLCKSCDEELKKAELVIEKFNLESVQND